MSGSPRRLELAEDLAPASAGFAAVTATSFANGGYFPSEWGWTLLAVALVGVLAVLVRERVAVGRLEAAAVAALAAFAGWTFLSVLWSPGADEPVRAGERTLVYAAALPVALLLIDSRRRVVPLLAGVLAAAAVVCGYALAIRLVPGWAAAYPPENGYQLQEPIGYWNALGILAAAGLLLALLLATEVAAPWGRALAAAPAPLLAASLYFTFSRGSWVALAAGACAAVALDRRRLRLLGQLLVVGAAAVAAVWLASRAHALTHEGASLADAEDEGRTLGLALLALSVAALLGGAALAWLERRVRLSLRTRRAIGASLVGLVALALVAGLVRAGGPAAVVDRARHSFDRSLPATGGDLNRRLVSLSSDGRSDYWRVAASEIGEHPWVGGGAGSYGRYWHRDRPTGYEAENAHNLYLETLAELGPIGLGLLLAALCLPLAAAVRTRGVPGVTAAAAALVAWLVHAGVDWDFQIPAVTLVAVACAGGLLGAARRAEPVPLGVRGRSAALAALLPLAAVAIAIQVGNSAVADANDALDRGDTAAATDAAGRARTWQPWSSTPWQLLGEASLAAEDPAAARRSFRHALERDRSDWAIWLDLAQASDGAARDRALAEAARLNPRSPEVAALRAG